LAHRIQIVTIYEQALHVASHADHMCASTANLYIGARHVHNHMKDITVQELTFKSQLEINRTADLKLSWKYDDL
jgi:hypothetical protein